MEEKNNQGTPKDEQSTPEIPENSPPPQVKPVQSSKKSKPKKQGNAIKLTYALALLLAFGGALVAKLVTESNLGTIEVPIESDYVTITESEAPPKTMENPQFEVRQNLTDVPDTRDEESETAAEPLSSETEVTTETTSEAETESPYAIPYKDYFTLPVGTEILRDYSPTTPAYNEITGDWRTHGGIDFKALEGDQVKAIAYGTVTEIYDDALYGTTVEIDHGNEVTAKYCGFNKDTVELKKGDTVKGGSLIGFLGEIPCEKNDTAHLHFEVYYKGENVDPLTLMNK